MTTPVMANSNTILTNQFALVVGTAGAVAQSGTSYSESIAFDWARGYVAVQVTSSAGSITVSQQCSMDGTNWYDAVDYLGTALGTVCSAMTVGTKFVQYDPVLCQYIRFKVVEGGTAPTVVSIKFLVQG